LVLLDRFTGKRVILNSNRRKKRKEKKEEIDGKTY